MPEKSAGREPDLLSTGALARALGISPSYVRKLESKGLTPLRMPDGRRAYFPSAIEFGRRLVKRLNKGEASDV